ncbi:hypothetical protein Btru_075305 [Bulinus truncatus]|nr:hypothetical protein Btru_075305 [Bulinus truncatus]
MPRYSFYATKRQRTKRKKKKKKTSRNKRKGTAVRIHQATEKFQVPAGLQSSLIWTERPESEYDRQWSRRGNRMNFKQFIECMVTVVFVFGISLFLFSPLIVMGINGIDLVDVAIMLPRLIHVLLFEIFVQMIVLLAVSIFGMLSYGPEDWKEWIDGCHIRYMDR